ncbi:hypothetical protein [Paracoccus nototheniae]|uniref:hypothetical protein n=1 Tax=Paracoccus nototheniae TaxID=2489002 RepID=UPI00103BB541|nr:hypothetical protein [Paracoccus nototheniae]
MAAALSLPALTLAMPISAQTMPPVTDGTDQDAPTGGSAAADGAVVGGGGIDADASADTGPEADASDDGETTGVAPDEADPAEGNMSDAGATTGSGESDGSAAESDSSVDMDELTHERVVGDLLSGRDFSDQLEGMDDTARVSIKGLSELDQSGGGALSTAETGNPPLTGGQTTNEIAGSAQPEPTPSGTSAGMTPDAPAAMADGGTTGPGTQTSGVSLGMPDDVDAALEQAGNAMTTLRNSLADHPPVIQALDDAGYTPQDVIALHREDDGLTVIVDDRDS